MQHNHAALKRIHSRVAQH